MQQAVNAVADTLREMGIPAGRASDLRLTIFDLDHTLLQGDSDSLWCDFLMREGLLARERFAPLNQAMGRDYRAGTVDVMAFCEFYVGALSGRSLADWAPWLARFLDEEITPRLPTAKARALVEASPERRRSGRAEHGHQPRPHRTHRGLAGHPESHRHRMRGDERWRAQRPLARSTQHARGQGHPLEGVAGRPGARVCRTAKAASTAIR
jgi:hypothetical protein